jgi:hypothetical protein
VLRGGQERPAGGDHPGAVVFEEGVAAVRLSADVLDRIDQIVSPGVTINVADNMWNFGTTALDAAFRRR